MTNNVSCIGSLGNRVGKNGVFQKAETLLWTVDTSKEHQKVPN